MKLYNDLCIVGNFIYILDWTNENNSVLPLLTVSGGGINWTASLSKTSCDFDVVDVADTLTLASIISIFAEASFGSISFCSEISLGAL